MESEKDKFYSIRGRSYRIHQRQKRKDRVRKGIIYEYDYDGLFYYERIKGADKRYWRRWLRREGKKELLNGI